MARLDAELSAFDERYFGKCHIKERTGASNQKINTLKPAEFTQQPLLGLFRMHFDKEHMAVQCLSADTGFLHLHTQ